MKSTLAILKIAKLQSVSATIEQDVEMLNQKFKITGDYKKAPNHRIYSSLKISDGLPDSSGTFLQVCDGETLWDYELVLEQPFYRRLTIKPILERLNSPDLDREIRTMAMTPVGPGRPRNAAGWFAEEHPLRHQGSDGPGRPQGLEDSRDVEEPARAALRHPARQSDGGLASLYSHGCESVSWD